MGTTPPIKISEDLPNPDGRYWLARFLEAQGKAQFQMLWLTFAIGQVGMGGQFAPADVTAELVEQMRTDVADLEEACEALVDVSRSILANAERNLGEG